MKKTIEPTDDGFTIRTVNGIDTRTGAVWVRELREYTPLENGFNLELAEHVFDFIEHNQHLWNQDSWREMLFTDDLSKKERKELRKMLAIGKDMEEPTCGTRMCFAGWVSELTGADYVADATALKEAKEFGLHPETLEWILVRRDELLGLRYTGSTFGIEDILPRTMVEKLRSRGFSEETHRLITVENFAEMQLGLRDGDWLNLFSGGNDLDDIKSIINEYAERGPGRVREDADELVF